MQRFVFDGVYKKTGRNGAVLILSFGRNNENCLLRAIKQFREVNFYRNRDVNHCWDFCFGPCCGKNLLSRLMDRRSRYKIQNCENTGTSGKDEMTFSSEISIKLNVITIKLT